MIKWIAAVVIALAPAQESAKKGIIVERNVKVFLRDTLDRLREIHRKERVSYEDGKLRIEDLTFGQVLIIRTDKKTVCTVDTFAETYTEHTFDQVRERQKEVFAEMQACRDRVKGSAQEAELGALLEGYGLYAAEPKIELRDTGKKEKIDGRDARERELVLNDNVIRLSAYVDPDLSDLLGYFDTLTQIGAFSSGVAEKLKTLGGFPVKGSIRYVLFLDRVLQNEEVTSVKRGEIPAKDFEPPGGLKKVSLQGFDPVEQKKVEKPKNFQPSFKEDDIDRNKKKKD